MRRIHYYCTVDGCDRKHSAHGYCLMHYKRLKRNGHTDVRTPEIRFWEKVDKTDTCWLWVASCGEYGYGQYKFDGYNYRAHRYSYELKYGNIPDGLVLDHLCRNVKCVNPDHLEIVSVRENIVRGNTVNNKKDHLPVGVIKATKNRFRARKWFNGKSIHLGYFLTAEAAFNAYRMKEGKDIVI